VAQGVGLLFVYSMGLGVPFILTGLGLGAFLRFFARYKRFIRWARWRRSPAHRHRHPAPLQRMTWLMRLMPQSLYRFSI